MAIFHLHRPNDEGNLGETIAANLLRQKGFTIVEQNLKVNAKEIDIIATNDEYIVFCEVKTRTSTFAGYPEESVTKEKQRNIVYAANAYLKIHHENRKPRFDIIGILLDPQTKQIQELNHIEDAFFPPQRTIHANSYSGQYRWHNKAYWKSKR
ncbi:MAG: YraN family protein [Paludibacteraceae bacterium]|nr:YraN family protein [Paludibacteraceae bacterium]